jgi:sugar/nucleoside kinase (ribokinase family)
MKGLFWGLTTIDLHFLTDHYPEENAKIKAQKFESYVGGPATNAAITYQHLGGNSRLVTAIGQNNFTQTIHDQLKKRKITFHDMLKDVKEDPVFASIITNIENGKRTIVSYLPKRNPLAEIADINDGYSIAVFDGFYIDSAIPFARLCKSLGITTVFDGGSWKHKTEKLLKYIDIAICSDDFFPPNLSNYNEITDYILQQGVQKVVISRGSKPMIVNEGEVNLLLEVPKVDVADTMGAGDIVMGAFCFFYAQSNNFLFALEKAGQVASLSCKYHGPREWMNYQ